MGKRRILSDGDCGRIRVAYEAGRSSVSLATEHGCGQNTIERAVIDAGGKMRWTNRTKLSPWTMLEIKYLYLGGMTVPRIKKRLNLSVSDPTIMYALRRLGVSLRSSGPSRTVEAYVRKDGYRRVLIDEGDPFYGMGGSRGRLSVRSVLEHRLVMARHLGRVLLPHETVHHRNGNRGDNRIENLELWIGKHGAGATEAHCRTCTCFHGARTVN